MATAQPVENEEDVPAVTENTQQPTTENSTPNEPITSTTDITTISTEPTSITQPETIPTTTPTTTPNPVQRNETLDAYLERFLQDNPNSVVLESPGYPAPYPADFNQTWRYL